MTFTRYFYFQIFMSDKIKQHVSSKIYGDCVNNV